MLTASRDALDRVASALLERETITAVELEALAGPPTTTSSREILTGKAR